MHRENEKVLSIPLLLAAYFHLIFTILTEEPTCEGRQRNYAGFVIGKIKFYEKREGMTLTIGSCIALLLLTFACLLYAAPIQIALAESVFLCLEVILPALYAMMIVSQLLIHTNAHMLLLRPFHWFSKKILRMPDVCLAIFLLSQLAGYPVGAKLLDLQLQSGVLSKRQASILSGVCFGSGPAFLFGTLSALTGDAGCRMLFYAMLFSNGVLLLLLTRFLHLPDIEPAPMRRLQADTLVRTVTQSGAALLQMCAMILFFRCLLAVVQASGVLSVLAMPLERLFPSELAAGLLSAFLEVTYLTQLPLATPLLFALFAALLSFGGVCVHLQIFAVTGGRLSPLWILLMRGIAAGLSALFCGIGCHFFPQVLLQQTAAFPVSAPAFQYSRTSPVASLLLVGATVLLLQSAAKQRQLRK